MDPRPRLQAPDAPVARVRAVRGTAALGRGLARLKSLPVAAILFNAGSIISTSLVSAALGAVYWWVAAQHFAPTDVGLASAALSVTNLLGTASLMGTGTLVIAELPPRSTSQRTQLIATTGALSAGTGLLLGGLFAVIAPLLSPEFAALGGVGSFAIIAALSVGLNAAASLVDHVFIGLLRGGLQTMRNVVLAIAKLAGLVVLALVPVGNPALGIYSTWLVGGVVSLGAAAAASGVTRLPWRAYRPDWHILRQLGRFTLQHHALNLASQAPSLVLPFLVTALLSASVNAYFYIAFTLATFVYMIPNALGTALYAVGSHVPARFAPTIRLTLALSVLGAVCADLFLVVAAGPILAVVGRGYGEAVIPLLQVLLLGAFPIIIRTHYITIYQVRRRLRTAIVVIAISGLVEILGAASGAHLGGIQGLTWGWLCALCLEALFMGPFVARAALP